ncbi:MAG: hypothetical protein P1U57_14955 [Oleibacter sp.]|nr:hypothetical protein [Thalassolituus sp.]
MGIAAEDILNYVIRPTLTKMGVNDPAAEQLLLATAAIESSLGMTLKSQSQRGSGLFRMHGLTHRNIWDDYLAMRADLASQVRGMASQREFLNDPHAELATNLRYAAALAWLAYVRQPNFKLPAHPSVRQLGELWKQFYHPRNDKSIEDFVERHKELIAITTEAA